MMWSGCSGTGTPQAKVVREIDRSRSPSLTNAITSLRAVRRLDELGVLLVVLEQRLRELPTA